MLNIITRFQKGCFALVSAGLCLAFYTSSAHAGHLDVNDRPKGLQRAINKKYDDLVASQSCNWSYNGAAEYKMQGLADDAVVKKIVEDHPDQEVFNFVDIGAGDHSWAQARVAFLNKEFADRKIHFNIFSLTGDDYENDNTVVKMGVKVDLRNEGLCSLYKLSAFPLENLTAKLKELGYFDMLSNKVSLMVAAYTLMHLVDPIGTFLQMHDLMQPGHGIMFIENMFGMGGHDTVPTSDFLRETNLEFFQRYGPIGFVVRRSDEKPASFPYLYVEGNYEVASPRAKYFTRERDLKDKVTNPKNRLGGYKEDSGSDSLRDSLPFLL